MILTATAPPLSDLFEQAFSPAHSPPTHDVFLFSGNPQESVPRALFLDRRLTPTERNAWQVIKLLMGSGGQSSLPTYERLRTYLCASPCAAKASFETVSKALTVLRLTRWITLVRRRRLPNGQIQSNLYVLHDEPLTPHETIQLDHDYFALVSKAMDHASKAIRYVGERCLKEIGMDETLGKHVLPTRLRVLTERLSHVVAPAKSSTAPSSHDSEEGSMSLLRNRYGLAPESEAGLKPAEHHALRNPKTDCSSSSNFIKNTTTEAERLPVVLPERFLRLSPHQQNLALTSIRHLDLAVQQQILAEWDRRCQGMTIRKPAAYLLGIVQKALQGELNALNQAPIDPQPVSAPPHDEVLPATPPADRQRALQHIAGLRNIVGGKKPLPRTE